MARISQSTVDLLKEAGLELAIGLVVVLVVRTVLGRTLDLLARRLARRPDVDEQRLRTQLFVLRRIAVILVVTIVTWRVLETFPGTRVIAQTLLASSAVIALFVGIAVQTPMSNLGSGLLLAVAQPVRLGDRASVEGITGTVEDITAIHTVLLTDDDRRVYVPNTTMISAPIDNRTIIDPRRGVQVRVPVRLHAPLDEVIDAVEAAAHGALAEDAQVRVLVVGETLSCTARDPSLRSRTLVVTVADETGTLDATLG